MRKLAIAVLVIGLALSGCSSSPSRPEPGQLLAETCNVFKLSHYGTKQVDMLATSGLRSGDAEIARDAARLQKEMKSPSAQVQSLIDLTSIAKRCARLGATTRSDLEKQLGDQTSTKADSSPPGPQ